jgi:hypothetical protein
LVLVLVLVLVLCEFVPMMMVSWRRWLEKSERKVSAVGVWLG